MVRAPGRCAGQRVGSLTTPVHRLRLLARVAGSPKQDIDWAPFLPTLFARIQVRRARVGPRGRADVMLRPPRSQHALRLGAGGGASSSHSSFASALAHFMAHPYSSPTPVAASLAVELAGKGDVGPAGACVRAPRR